MLHGTIPGVLHYRYSLWVVLQETSPIFFCFALCEPLKQSVPSERTFLSHTVERGGFWKKPKQQNQTNQK